MAVTVKIPAQLRPVVDGRAVVEVATAGTVSEVLDALYDQYPDLQTRISDNGELRRFVNVYVADEDIRFGDGLETIVADGAEVTILPAVAGG
ncbi:MAG: ubiquitin-like small modifier protein 1 [Solirubrobacterales bacterium]